MIVLGIETSCDETSCAVVKDGGLVLSNAVASSLKLHQKYKGIIPEIASRAQLEYISLVTSAALKNSQKKINDIDLICVTKGPGLVGSLLVGVSFAKAMSYAWNKPILGVGHLQAHLYASFLSLQAKPQIKNKRPPLPFVGLVVSGGHTSLYLVGKDFDFRLLGSTTDDAAGEAFDKVARILGLGYPGGPIIEKLAQTGDERKAKFSCRAGGELNFSFSGIKTAVLYKVQSPKSKVKSKDTAAGFQKAVVDVLIEKSIAACRLNSVNTLVVGGGVAANSYLRQRFNEVSDKENIKVYFPPAALCLDNAAMIAGLGYQLFRNGIVSNNYLTALSLL